MRPFMVVILASILSMGLAFDSEASARCLTWFGSGGWEAAGDYCRLYDKETRVTVSGEVLKVEAFTPRKGMTSGVRLWLKTDADPLQVHLGPKWFLDHQELRIIPDNFVEVTGSRGVLEGKKVIFAATVSCGSRSLTLRDDAGWPMWSASRSR